MPTPPVLLEPAFLPLWQRISAVLDRRGVDHRGWLQLPDDLPDAVYARLGEVVGGRFSTTRRRLDLARLDRGLARHGTDVATVLADAGCPPLGRKEQRDTGRERLRVRDEVLETSALERLGDEPWVHAWTREIRSTIPDDAGARHAVDTVCRVLEAATEPGVRSRAEIAARVLGPAHSLDRGTPARRWVGTALALRAGVSDRDDPDLWSDAGLPGDLVSAPVLTWALPLRGDGPAVAVRAATSAGAPAPLTMLTLRDLLVDVPPGTVVLSVENPRLLEAAVQRGIRRPVICTFGHPTRAVVLLVRALVAAGAEVRHHGDVDPDGLAITARLADGLGVLPWRMTVADYAAALAAAEADGVALRRIEAPVPPTPWDPDLRRAVETAGLAVEEERVMDDLLAEHDAGG